jgi:hypothetical protein
LVDSLLLLVLRLLVEGGPVLLLDRKSTRASGLGSLASRFLRLLVELLDDRSALGVDDQSGPRLMLNCGSIGPQLRE